MPVLVGVFLDFLERDRKCFVQRLCHVLRRQGQHKRRLIVFRRAIPNAEAAVVLTLGSDEPK